MKEPVKLEYSAPLAVAVHRKGRKVSVTMTFEDDYQAMQIYSVWANPTLRVSVFFEGPREVSEEDDDVQS